MNKCMKGWDNIKFNHRGDCCCNCKFFKKLMKHPWNEDLFKGHISEQVAIGDIPVYVCIVSDETFSMTREYSMCECHARKEDNTL